MNRILLCAGGWTPEGYKRLDASPEFSPDYLVRLPCAIPGAPYDEIQLIHGIEHFYLWEAIDLLSYCYHALSPGGILVLEQPNIERAALVLLGQMDSPTENVEQSSLWAIYGNPEKKDPLMAHKSGWTPMVLEETLRRCGNWARIDHMRARFHVPLRDFRVEAAKA